MTRIQVEYDGTIVGCATEEGERFSFTYDEAWLDAVATFPLSASLPLRAESFPAEVAHNFFANLLPEGGAREAICRRLGISVDNDIALLAALGDDTAGAFRFVVEGARRDARPRRRLSQGELQDWSVGHPAILVDEDELPRLSLAGAQHKVSVVIDEGDYWLPAGGEPSTHILKFDSQQFPHLAANEFLTMNFAAELGVEVAEVELDERTSPPFLVIRRYDRVDAEGALRRLHQEDFCQILGLPPTRKYESEGGPSLAEIAEQVRHLSSSPARDLLRLIRWVVVVALTGNADGHAKNLSLLYGADGTRLAPAYDVVCTRAFERLDPRLAMSVGGERDPDRLTQERWQKFAAALAVRPRLVLQEVERLVEESEAGFRRASARLADAVGESPAHQHVARAVRKRIRALRGNLE